MGTFAKHRGIVNDLKICLLRNRTSTPFITSDDPAVLANRWHLQDRRTKGRSFGLGSAGNLLILPLSSQVLCLGYDGDVYNVSHESGWANVRHDSDIQALNQLQFLNCMANIYVHDSVHAQSVRDSFIKVAQLRPKSKHIINYAVLDSNEGNYTRYRVVDRALAGDHQEAIVHTQTIHASPSAWPKQLLWRPKGVVFTNGTGLGYIRRASPEMQVSHDFWKELSRQAK